VVIVVRPPLPPGGAGVAGLLADEPPESVGTVESSDHVHAVVDRWQSGVITTGHAKQEVAEFGVYLVSHAGSGEGEPAGLGKGEIAADHHESSRGRGWGDGVGDKET